MEACRLNKFLASRGVASRRRCDDLVKGGRVLVNGSVVLQPGTLVVPGRDVVQVDGSPVSELPARHVVMLNKPAGYIVSAKDQRGRRSVLELVPPSMGRLFPVGRLDLNTEGLLLLTNDGTLAYHITHPSHGVVKRYDVVVRERPEPRALRSLRSGVGLGEGVTSSPARVSYAGPVSEGHLLRLAIKEGRKRQVRRMCAAVGLRVTHLVRTGIGPLELGTLPKGSWRELGSEEVEALLAAARP